MQFVPLCYPQLWMVRGGMVSAHPDGAAPPPEGPTPPVFTHPAIPSTRPAPTVWRQQPQQQNLTGPAAPAAEAPPAASPPAPGPIPPLAAPAPPAPPVVPPGAAVASTTTTTVAPPAGDDPSVEEMAAWTPQQLHAYAQRLRGGEEKYRRQARTAQEEAAEAAATKAAAVTEAQQKLAADFARFLNGGKDPEGEPTPDKLKDQFAKRENTYQERLRESALKAALTGTLPYAKAAILGERIIADLDPMADGFEAEVDKRVSQYLDKYPELKGAAAVVAAPPVPAVPLIPQTGFSGADFNGTTAGAPGGPASVEEMRDARRKARES